jgi:hypothetical protein
MEVPYILIDEKDVRDIPLSPTAFRTKEPGVGHLYSLEAVKGTMLFLSYIQWESGNCEVRVEAVESDVDSVHRLTHGLRLSIERVDYQQGTFDAIPLRSARIQEDGTWSNLFDLSLRAIDDAAGFAAIDALRELGVAHIIKGHEIPAKAARRTQREFALYAPRDQLIPIHASLLPGLCLS